MVEIITFNGEPMEFEQDSQGRRIHHWMLGSTRCTWKSSKEADVYVKRIIYLQNGIPVEKYFLNQEPEGTLIKRGGYLRRKVSSNEYRFLGRPMGICPAEGIYFPPELPDILNYVENNWGWHIDAKIRDLLGGFQSDGL